MCDLVKLYREDSQNLESQLLGSRAIGGVCRDSRRDV
jgi:hypothetical protein